MVKGKIQSIVVNSNMENEKKLLEDAFKKEFAKGMIPDGKYKHPMLRFLNHYDEDHPEEVETMSEVYYEIMNVENLVAEFNY